MLREKRPALDRNLGLVLTFFCTGTPSTKGTLDLMKSLNVSPEKVASVRYRGDGWPGRFEVISADDGGGEKSLSYIGIVEPALPRPAFRCQFVSGRSGTSRGHHVRRCMGAIW